MTRFSALTAATWLALCFLFLDSGAVAMANDILPSAGAIEDDMDGARVRVVLYSIVPLLLWIFEALRKESGRTVILHD